MNCNNCTNNNALKEVKIKHVHGNVLRMAIPLTLRTIELVDGEINATDTPFVPSSEHPVKVVFSKKGSVSVALDATMKDGNIAYIEEKGKIPVGTYAITVTCNDDNGNPYRFKQNAVLYVADATIEAGIEETIEYEVTTWYLDAAIFLALKGEDGVGIYDIETQSSGEIGGVNTVTFILTDGRTRSFNILNGSGAVDSDLDINSPSPIANSAVTAKFNELSGELADLFGDVDYDTSSKSIRFWDKGKTNVLASLDARPFIKDGMVSNAYISNNTLVITFNTDSGKEAIGVPLTSVFNPNNYYTKTQVDSRIASAVANINLSNYYTKAQIDAKLSQKVNLDATTGRVDASQATRVVLDYIVGIYDGEDEPSHEVNAGDVWYDNGQIHYAYNNDVTVVIISLGAPQKDIIYCNAENNKLYRWNGSEFVQVGGGNSEGGYEPPVGGIPKSDLAQSVQDTLDDVSNKVDKVAGKGLSTEDYTTAEKQKLAGLNNYDDTEIQAEVDAKYERPSTGIPKSDLASGVQSSLDAADSAYQKPNGGIPKSDLASSVQASLGKADTALQSSDLEGYATTDDVDDAVAALVSSAPQTLDTLNELAEALGDDPNFATTMATQLGNKVDKETGKGLSTNDYTTAEKNKLAGLENYDDSALQTAIAGKVDKESGKSLMTDAEHTKLAGIDPSTYATKTEVNAKQDTINDLDAIRSGAALGATALQSFTETDPNVPDWAKQQTKPTYTAQEVGALPASTTIPTKVSDLTNDSGFTSNSPATNVPIMDGTANVGSSAKYAREDHVHPHDTTKANDNAVVKSVTINGQTPQLNNGNVDLGTIHDGVDGDDGITPHIGQDGYWYIGTTNTGVKAQGERGNDGVASADEVVVVNNLDGEPADLEEGQVAVLGADQGKELKMAIDNKGVSFEVKGDTLFIRTASSPMVNVLPTSIQFDDTIFGNTRTATVHIYGRNLTNQVSVQVSGVGFSGSTTILPDIDGKVDADVTITFAPTASTGTEEESGRSYEGSVTAVCNGAESASATLEGFGVLTITPRITASIDKAALKGVLDTTADGQYSSEPATATLHVQASNINQVLTLAVDNAKFALSESQVSVEDALRGKDITVTYLRQSAVTATDDEGTITITATHDSTSVQSTVAVSGTTGAKITSGTIGTFDGITYSYDGSDVACKKSSSTPIELVIPAYFYDGYGYKYTPVAFHTNAFASSAIRSLVAGSNISKVYSYAFSSCTSLKTAVFKNWSIARDSMFSGCTALESVDFTSINFSSRYNIFSGCTKLASVTVRSSSKVYIGNKSNFTKATLTIDGEDKEVFYYVDSDGNNQQKKLYVPSALVSSYQQDAIWGMFDVQPISE